MAHYRVIQFRVDVPGSAYTAGDLLVISGGEWDEQASVEVASTNGSGVITGITNPVQGDYTEQPSEDPTPMLGGTGTGAQFHLTWQEFDPVGESSSSSTNDGPDNPPITINHPEAHEKLTGRLFWREVGSVKGYNDAGNVLEYTDASSRTLVVRHRSQQGARFTNDEQTDVAHDAWSMVLDENVAEQSRLIRLVRSTSEQRQRAVEAASATLEEVQADRWFDIGAFLIANWQVSGLAGILTEGDDYQIDAKNGRLQVVAGGSVVNGESLTITFDEPALRQQKQTGQTKPAFRCEVVLEETNQHNPMFLRRHTFTAMLNMQEFAAQTGEFGKYKLKVTPTTQVLTTKRNEALTLPEYTGDGPPAESSSSSSRSSSSSVYSVTSSSSSTSISSASSRSSSSSSTSLTSNSSSSTAAGVTSSSSSSSSSSTQASASSANSSSSSSTAGSLTSSSSSSTLSVSSSSSSTTQSSQSSNSSSSTAGSLTSSSSSSSSTVFSLTSSSSTVSASSSSSSSTDDSSSSTFVQNSSSSSSPH